MKNLSRSVFGDRASRSSRSRTKRDVFRRLGLENLEYRRVLTDVSGTLSGIVNWSASQNPIRLVGDVFVPAGTTLNIQPGVNITKSGNFTLRVANSGDGGVINANQATFSIDVSLGANSTGLIQASRWNTDTLMIGAGSNIQLSGNSFHSGATQETSPIWVAPNQTHKLTGSVFDNAAAEATQIGVLAGTINNQAVTWSKLPGVAGYRLLHFSSQSNDVVFNSGASLTIASGNTVSRENAGWQTAMGTLIVGATGAGALTAIANSNERITLSLPIVVNASSSANITRASVSSILKLSGAGSLTDSRFDAGRLELPATSTVTVTGNSFHSGDIQDTTPIWIAPNLTHRLLGSTFDSPAGEATQIGVLAGTISNQAVTWSKLPGVAGYRLLHFSSQSNDVVFNSGASLIVASGNTVSRENAGWQTAMGTLIIGATTVANLELSGITVSLPVVLGPAAQGAVESSAFTSSANITIHAGASVNVSKNDFRLVPQIFAVGSPNSTINLNGNYWGTTTGSEIEAKITHRPDTSPASRPLVTFSNPISPNAIGGSVWDDANGDGRRSSTELGRPDVSARLRGVGVDGLVGTADDDSLSDVPAVVTNSTGAYQFIVPSQHVTKRLYVEFTKPGGTEFTIRNAPFAGDTLDSDVDGTGKSDALNWFDKRVDFTTDAGLVTQAPEIEVSLSGIDLFDGWSRVNFGQTEAGTPVSRTFVVTNVGNAPLTLSQPTFASGTGFTISQPLSSLSLAPGASTSFVATMTAQSVAILNSRLQLMSNDGDEGSFDLTFLGEVKTAQSQADIRMLSVTSNGTATVTVQYEIAVANAPAFSVGVYRTENGLSLTGATLLDSFDITLPSELSVGTHTKSFTIGGNVNELAFPGLGAADLTNSDYRILFVADPSDAITEPDGNPLSEDNQSLFVGAYKAGTSLFVHGSDSPDSIQFAPTGTNHSLTINGGTPINYATSSITTVYLRTHAGNDTVQANTATRAMVVMGGEDNDTIDTGTAADVLIGKGGDDLLRGGSGNDTYRFDADENLGVDSLSDSVGLETLDFSETTSAVSVNLALTSTQAVNGLLGLILDSPTTFDNIKGGAGNDQLFGNSSANVLTGGAGNDQLAGVGGNDTYLFDADTPLGSDQLTDTTGVDTISFDGTTSSGVVLNLALTTAQVVNPRLTLALATGNSFENIIGGTGADTLTGNALANQFTGGAGNDQLSAAAGNDTYLFDTDLALGTDTLNEVGGGNDTLSFATTTTRVIAIDLGNSASQVVNAGLSLILGSANSIENVLGGSQADTITGNSLANSLTGNGGDDTLIGLDGADILIGNAGNDTLRGGLGDDSYLFDGDSFLGADIVDETGGGGVDTLDYTATTTRSLTINLGNSAQQTVEATNQLLTLVNAASSIENVIGGSLNDSLTGNDLDNFFKGNAGNDTITGGLGNDTYQFDVDVAQGSDTISDAGGIDMFNFSQSTAQQVTLDLSLASQAVNANLNLTLNAGTNIENAIGGSKNDTLIGNGLDNLLLGGAGNDTIRGGNGKDVLLGGAGNDVLEGGDAEDLLISGTTSFDANYSNLRIIQAAWSSSDPYQTRVNNLRAGVSGVALTAKTTVINSGTDSLRGDSGRDWYFAGLDDSLVDQAVDELNDVL